MHTDQQRVSGWPNKPHISNNSSRRALMRTGCIPCLNAGRKCDPSNVKCQYRAISESWRINQFLPDEWGGSWRERHGIHTFIHFAYGIERAGHFKSDFWQSRVLLACLNHKALYCVGSAIGTLHEHVLGQPTFNSPHEQKGLAFALQQCNRAISLLTSAGKQQIGAEVAIVACILFIYFEAMQGNTTQAITHCLQGRRLLETLEREAAAGRTSGLITPDDVDIIMNGLELQAVCVVGNAVVPLNRLSALRELKLPVFDRLFNLNHAHDVLEIASLNIMSIMERLGPSMSICDLTNIMAERSYKFVPWLEKWDACFTEFLAANDGSLTARDRKRGDILVVNWRLLIMYAKVDITNGRAVWAGFLPHFQAITNMSASILSTYAVGLNTTLSSVQFPFLSHGLWVSEPLFITMARCSDRKVRRKAAQLLLVEQKNMANNEGSRFARSSKGKCDDIDAWDEEDWMDFAWDAPLDTGTAVFFGRFPRPEVIDSYLH